MSLFRRSAQRGKSKGEEGYGRGQASIAEGDDVLLDEEAMVAALTACLEAPDYEPPTLPSVAVELMSLSQRSDVEIDDVVALLEQDSMIAGRVLKLVRSPIYAGVSEIQSLRDALMRVGVRTLRNLVMEIAMNLKVFRSPHYSDTMELLRRHATMTAHIARIVCKHGKAGKEDAFLAGLLHDVGIAGTLLALSDRKAGRKTPPDLIAIWPAVDRVHARAGEIMIGHWNLPAEIQGAVAAHHQVLVRGEPDLLAAGIALADDLAHEHGFGVTPKSSGGAEEATATTADYVSSHVNVDRSLPRTLEEARSALDLDDEKMDAVRAEVAQLESPFA